MNKPADNHHRASRSSPTSEGVFQWNGVAGQVVAEAISARWRKGCWEIHACRGRPDRPHYQHFHLQIPAENAETGISRKFVTMTDHAEPGFTCAHAWNRPVAQPADFQTISAALEGIVEVNFTPTDGRFAGRFYYITAQGFSPGLEGHGKYDFTVRQASGPREA